MPFGVNLAYALLLSVFSLVVLLSNRKNKINQLYFIGGMIFSLGVWKEYFFFDLVPFLVQRHAAVFSMQTAESIYSIMTAILYLLAMPVAFIFSLHFAGKHSESRLTVFWMRAGMLCAVLLFSLFFRPERFRQYQLTSRVFWILITIYNIAYGVALTLIMLKAIRKERETEWKRQKISVSILVLPLLWAWLITIFVVHAIDIKPLFHVWQCITVFLVILAAYYLIIAFRNGIMGIRFRVDRYNWEPDTEIVRQCTSFVNHFLKNEVAKISWCSNNLTEKFLVETSHDEVPEEIEIINRSVRHLNALLQKSQAYSKDFDLNYSNCTLFELVSACVEGSKRLYDNKKTIDFKIQFAKDIQVYCDESHLTEMLNNLLNNAADAIEDSGTIRVGFKNDKKRKMYILFVEDNGEGISNELMPHLFEPYYTSKSGADHFGLGLFYCNRVMKNHNGTVEVKSKVKVGTVINLCFPKRFCVHAGNGVLGE